MTGLYRLREADRSVRLAVVLFLLVLGYGYTFAFQMVRHWAGLTPARVAETYAPDAPVAPSALPSTTHSHTRPIDLAGLGQEAHRVDTELLVQDSHIHILMYAVVAALLTLILLGLEWPAMVRDAVIVIAFGSGALDFVGQWLMKAGMPGFAWLTILSGWLMAGVYLVVLVGALRCLSPRRGRPVKEVP
jgi:hypothetical protein